MPEQVQVSIMMNILYELGNDMTRQYLQITGCSVQLHTHPYSCPGAPSGVNKHMEAIMVRAYATAQMGF